MPEGRPKIVRFDYYCVSCKYLKTSSLEDPCNECLTSSVNIDSYKPVNYSPDKSRKKLPLK